MCTFNKGQQMDLQCRVSVWRSFNVSSLNSGNVFLDFLFFFFTLDMADQSPPSHLTSKRQIKIWKRQQAENATKRQKVESYVNQNPFRYAERQFKARILPKDVMSHVIDTSHLLNEKDKADLLERHATLKPIKLTQDLRHECPSLFGDEVTDEWTSRALDGYVLTDIPGN